jgi:hypothetical protein
MRTIKKTIDGVWTQPRFTTVLPAGDHDCAVGTNKPFPFYVAYNFRTWLDVLRLADAAR